MYRSISIVILTFILSKNCFGQFTIQNCQKSPIYKENGGYKKTNLLNKAKVKKESASLMICQLLREIENALKSKNEADKILNEKDAIYQLKEKAIRETSNNLVEIAKKLEGNKISSTKDYEERFLSPFVAAERGYIDEVIMPHSTRRRVARALAMLATKKAERPWKKHDNIPL